MYLQRRQLIKGDNSLQYHCIPGRFETGCSRITITFISKKLKTAKHNLTTCTAHFNNAFILLTSLVHTASGANGQIQKWEGDVMLSMWGSSQGNPTCTTPSGKVSAGRPLGPLGFFFSSSWLRWDEGSLLKYIKIKTAQLWQLVTTRNLNHSTHKKSGLFWLGVLELIAHYWYTDSGGRRWAVASWMLSGCLLAWGRLYRVYFIHW